MGAVPKPPGDERQERVGCQRKGDHDDRAADHLRVIAGLQARVQETAQAVVRRVGRQGGRRDHLQGRRAHARRDEAGRVRDLHLREDLGLRESNRSRRIHGRARRRGNPRIGCRQQWRNRQHQERQRWGREADAQPQARKRQHSQGGDRSCRARRAHQPPAPARMTDHRAQRQCDERREDDN